MKRILVIAVLTLMVPSLLISKAITSEADYAIIHVDHNVEIMHNGYILMKDTIQTTGQLSTFLIGIPFKYGSYVLNCVAYVETTMLPITFDVPLEDHMNFYGVEIRFPQETITSVFTVAFVLSRDLLTSSAIGYNLDFPAYPGLVKPAANCSVTLIVPQGSQNINIIKNDGSVNASSYTKGNLPAFTYATANATFLQTGEKISMVDIKEIDRRVMVSGIGEIECSDTYRVKSTSPETINSIQIMLPHNASNPSAHDQFGRTILDFELVSEETNRYGLVFPLPLQSNQFTTFTMKYDLPSQLFLSSHGDAHTFNVTSLFFQNVNHYVEQGSLTFVLPEGAQLLSSENFVLGSTAGVTKTTFQETVVIKTQGINYLAPLQSLSLRYSYNPLWLSFRPTLWASVLSVLVISIVVLWKRPRPTPGVVLPEVALELRPEVVTSFVKLYGEKQKISLELASLQQRVRKRKISRRRYKVRRKTLETRLNVLSKTLMNYREQMLGARGKKRDFLRQLNEAENSIKELEANIQRVVSSHRRGELSLQDYRKLLAEYQRNKENVASEINGILLRLSE